MTIGIRQGAVVGLLALFLGGCSRNPLPLEVAAMRGDAAAQYKLGVCYAKGACDLPKDKTKAIKWVTQAAENGFSEAQNLLDNSCGVSLFAPKSEWVNIFGDEKGEDHQYCEKDWGIMAAEQGNIQAQARVGKAYIASIASITGSEKEKKGIQWLINACDGRIAEACSDLGDFYRAQNKKEAIHFYLRAADLGDKESLCEVTSVLFDLEKDGGLTTQEAFNRYRQAAKRGQAEGLVWFGHRQFDKKNYKLAYQAFMDSNRLWVKPSKKNGDLLFCLGEDPTKEIAYQLGEINRKGLGTKKNFLEAVYWYSQANSPYEKGDAFEYIAEMYMAGGYGLFQSNEAAKDWYLKAAQEGSLTAVHNLGYLYFKGLGTPKNDIQAYKWFNLAASHSEGIYASNREAESKILTFLEGRMSRAEVAEAQRLATIWDAKRNEKRAN